jgi:hypothetical protein
MIILPFIVFIAALFVAVCAPAAWLLMLALGGIAHATGWAIAIGYFPSLLITIIAALFVK